MRILLTNDDGISYPGIRLLAAELCGEHEVCIVTPASQRSGASHSVTFIDPLFLELTDPALEGFTGHAYGLSGTPVECLWLALDELFPQPDLVIAGINNGHNLGNDIFLSGTVNVAIAAALRGVPAISSSLCAHNSKDYLPAVKVTAKLVEYVKTHPIPPRTVWNLNVPNIPLAEMKGVAFPPLDKNGYRYSYVTGKSPIGMDYYWPDCRYYDPWPFEGAPKTDREFIEAGYVTLTPITVDLTDHAGLEKMKEQPFGL